MRAKRLDSSRVDEVLSRPEHRGAAPGCPAFGKFDSVEAISVSWRSISGAFATLVSNTRSSTDCLTLSPCAWLTS